MSDERILIVGAGQAGARTALALRRLGHSGSIILTGEECELPYERPMLSKEFLLLDGYRHKPIMSFEQADAAGIDMRLGWLASGINRDARSVRYVGRQSISYDRLVLATGGRAANPPGGASLAVLRTLADVRRLLAIRGSSRRLAIVGGGWIGLEIAAAAAAKGIDVLLCETRDRLCARILPSVASEYLFALHRTHGVAIALNEQPTVEPLGSGIRLRMRDGDQTADAAVFAGGLVANDRLAANAGLQVAKGIVTDAEGRTTDPSIFAVGDCSIFRDRLSGEFWHLQSWQNANSQAEAVAHAILGKESRHTAVPWFWSSQYGKTISIVGMPSETDEPEQASYGPEDRPLWRFHVGTNRETLVAVDRPAEVRAAIKILNRRRETALAHHPSIAAAGAS
jgi:3-phenylpropionate/trans-cinnamate dioxygenase ferredoxin reductase subunit